MSNGRGCNCAARSSHECGCDADWTSQETIDLRAKLASAEKVLEAINDFKMICEHTHLREKLSPLQNDVISTMFESVENHDKGRK